MTRSPAQTRAWGKRLGRLLHGGEWIGVTGGLGSGKTTFIQGIAEGLEIPGRDVSSPTFLLTRELEGRLPLRHLDLYRVEHPDQARQAGLLEPAADPRAVTVIEWADRAGGWLPEDRLAVRIDPGPSARSRALEFSAPEGAWSPLLRKLPGSK